MQRLGRSSQLRLQLKINVRTAHTRKLDFTFALQFMQILRKREECKTY